MEDPVFIVNQFLPQRLRSNMPKGLKQKSTIMPLIKIIPPEIIELILKNLDYESLSFARLTCRQWQKIIDSFKLLKTASCEYISIT